MDQVCMRGVCAPARAHPPRRQEAGNPRSPWTLQQKKKRHAAHTAQSRPRVRSDACRMGHPRRRVTVRPGPDTGLPTVVARIFDQITTETGRASRLDLFGIPALLERLEGDPEISKATVSVR
jgi:hypothetical protein